MGILGMIGAAAKATTGYAAARGKERTTALGGGLCIAALYFRVTHPRAMDETMFYIVFGLGIAVAALKTEFMRSLGIVLVDAMKGRSAKRKDGGRKGGGRKGGK